MAPIGTVPHVVYAFGQTPGVTLQSSGVAAASIISARQRTGRLAHQITPAGPPPQDLPPGEPEQPPPAELFCECGLYANYEEVSDRNFARWIKGWNKDLVYQAGECFWLALDIRTGPHPAATWSIKVTTPDGRPAPTAFDFFEGNQAGFAAACTGSQSAAPAPLAGVASCPARIKRWVRVNQFGDFTITAVWNGATCETKIRVSQSMAPGADDDEPPPIDPPPEEPAPRPPREDVCTCMIGYGSPSQTPPAPGAAFPRDARDWATRWSNVPVGTYFKGIFSLFGPPAGKGAYEIRSSGAGTILFSRPNQPGPWSASLTGVMVCGQSIQFHAQVVQPGSHTLVGTWGRDLICTAPLSAIDAPTPPAKPIEPCECLAYCINSDQIPVPGPCQLVAEWRYQDSLLVPVSSSIEIVVLTTILPFPKRNRIILECDVGVSLSTADKRFDSPAPHILDGWLYCGDKVEVKGELTNEVLAAYATGEFKKPTEVELLVTFDEELCHRSTIPLIPGSCQEVAEIEGMLLGSETLQVATSPLGNLGHDVMSRENFGRAYPDAGEPGSREGGAVILAIHVVVDYDVVEIPPDCCVYYPTHARVEIGFFTISFPNEGGVGQSADESTLDSFGWDQAELLSNLCQDLSFMLQTMCHPFVEKSKDCASFSDDSYDFVALMYQMPQDRVVCKLACDVEWPDFPAIPTEVFDHARGAVCHLVDLELHRIQLSAPSKADFVESIDRLLGKRDQIVFTKQDHTWQGEFKIASVSVVGDPLTNDCEVRIRAAFNYLFACYTRDLGEWEEIARFSFLATSLPGETKEDWRDRNQADVYAQYSEGNFAAAASDAPVESWNDLQVSIDDVPVSGDQILTVLKKAKDGCHLAGGGLLPIECYREPLTVSINNETFCHAIVWNFRLG